jgi:hypothetical protein
LLYGKSERKLDAHNVKLDRRLSVRDANNVTRFSERSMKTMRQNDYKRGREMRC